MQALKRGEGRARAQAGRRKPALGQHAAPRDGDTAIQGLACLTLSAAL